MVTLKNPSIFLKLWPMNHKKCNTIVVEDGFVELTRVGELVCYNITFQFARIDLWYAVGLRESGNYEMDTFRL